MHDLAGLLAKKFIARTDVKAVQTNSGEYMPVQHCPVCHRGFCSHDEPKVREGWKRSDVNAHLEKQKTYGHYLLNHEDQCKLFAFDIDLDKPGLWDKLDESIVPRYPFPYDSAAAFAGQDLHTEIREFDPREAWLDRAHPARAWMKFQLKTVAHTLARVIQTELEIPVACAYTGAKGLHVYGFTGLMSAKDVREGAQIVIDSMSDTALGPLLAIKGDCFFRFENQDPISGQPNLTIELFPKQDSLDGKDLGNLMRLPLGKNLKNEKDPTFFIDMTQSLDDLRPIDPVHALTGNNCFRRPGD